MKNFFTPAVLALSASLMVLNTSSCKTAANTSGAPREYPAFFQVGHRGTRGLMPENSIPAMIKGIEVGANTIEFDIHVSKDGQVLVYHDDSFDPKYTTMSDGSEIPKDQREKYTFYQMNYADIRPFIIGMKPYDAFPQQERLSTYAPLLSEMIDSVEEFTSSHNLPQVYYLLEIKSDAKSDGFEQPVPEEFVKKMMATLERYHLGHRLIVQSFDMRPLQVMHRLYPDVKLGFLTGDKKVSFEENLTKLAFTPQFYNPNSELVTPELVKKCHDLKMLIEPWTVNTVEEMKKIKAMGVDGIITDYPNFFKQL